MNVSAQGNDVTKKIVLLLVQPCGTMLTDYLTGCTSRYVFKRDLKLTSQPLLLKVIPFYNTITTVYYFVVVDMYIFIVSTTHNMLNILV